MTRPELHRRWRASRPERQASREHYRRRHLAEVASTWVRVRELGGRCRRDRRCGRAPRPAQAVTSQSRLDDAM